MYLDLAVRRQLTIRGSGEHIKQEHALIFPSAGPDPEAG
jgi:hypothetical protein